MKNLNKLVVALGMTSALFLVGCDKEKSSDMAKDNAMARPSKFFVVKKLPFREPFN